MSLMAPAGQAVAQAWQAPQSRVERRVRFERHVRKHRDQPEARPEPGIDEKVVAAEPAQSRRPPDVLVREVGPLPLPIDDLRGRDGQRPEALLLDVVGDEQGAAVEEEVHLPIMVEVDRGRMVMDVVEDGVAQALPQRDG